MKGGFNNPPNKESDMTSKTNQAFNEGGVQ